MNTSSPNSQPDWHRFELDEVILKLDSSASGLTTRQVVTRMQQYGVNALPEKEQRPLFVILVRQFRDFMILVLLAAAIISGIIGEPQDTIAILVIVLLNAIIGAVQEYRAERAVAALKRMSAPTCQVLRDGYRVTLPATDLAPGDIVFLEAGDIVPADLRFIEVEQLQVDESALTGESMPVEKTSDRLDQDADAVGDRLNMGFKNSQVTHGRGSGIVTAIGLQTEIGQIAALLQEETSAKTPLQVRMSRFGHYLAIVILAICLIVFLAGLIQGQPPLLMLLTAVSLAVAAIPEALPAVITVSLAIGAHKLVRQNALVRNLPAVETLGSITYICADKTGTLTENRMKVELIMTDGETCRSLKSASGHALDELGRAMALNNDIVEKKDGPSGEPTELALYLAAHEAGFTKADIEKAFPRVAVLAFDSTRKRMTSIHSASDGYAVYTKGAPEQVLDACTNTWQSAGKVFDCERILAEASHLAHEGYRVIAYARRDLKELPAKPSPDTIEHELCFVGLVALIDPPRAEAPAAVSSCKQAGITPVMITGDHPGTASAIAARLGISNADTEILSGEQLEQMTDEEFKQCVESIRVYARVSPRQKLRIIKALQANNEFVAMTGDGVNDAPALKRAGIGIAMGKKGTDVAREAADMVLLDDNFATIVRAIREGRRIFDNIRKFIKYTMTSNTGEILTLFMAPFLGMPLPLLPIHILWINLVTDGLPGLALTTEPDEPDIMKRQPRPPEENIFAHGMWQDIIWVGMLIGGLSLFAMAWALSRNAEHWQTMVFTVLTLSQLFNVLGIRSDQKSLFTIGLFTNPQLIVAVFFTFLLQMAVIYVPALNTIFHTDPLPLLDLIACILISSVVLIAIEIEKWLMRHGFLYKT